MEDRYSAMTKEALRAECRDYEITGYGKMNNEQMREALRKADKAAADFDEADAEREYLQRQEIQARLDEQNRIAEEAAVAAHPMFVAPTEKPTRGVSGHSNGLKIEANRQTNNGVTRPSVGGKCRAVWDMLDEMTHKQAEPVTAKQAREQAAKRGFDKTTTMVQFYRWRKFNGIEGRQA